MIFLSEITVPSFPPDFSKTQLEKLINPVNLDLNKLEKAMGEFAGLPNSEVCTPKFTCWLEESIKK